MMQTAPIESLCSKVTSGGTPSRKHPEFYADGNGGHLWVKSKELLDGAIDDTEERISDEGLQRSSAKYLPANTVLIAMYGANVGQLGWLRCPATVNQAVCGMVVDKKIADPRYVFYALLHTRPGLAAKAQGAAQQNLNQGLLKEFEIPVPNLEVQKRIAAILSAYDDLIENNLRRIKILEEMAQNLYREWFVKFRFPGHDQSVGEPVGTAEGRPEGASARDGASQQVRMVDSPLGKIPEGWDVVPFSEIYGTGSGGTPSRKVPKYYGGDHPWIKTRELKDGFVLETEENITDLGLKKSSAKLFPENTVVIAMYGATIGMLGILTRSAATNQACAAILPKERGFGRAYAFSFLAENRKELIALGQGAAQQNISQVVIKKLPTLRPPTELVEEFSEIAESMLDSIRNLQQKNRTLRQTRDLILPKLISGELDVTELDIDTGKEAA